MDYLDFQKNLKKTFAGLPTQAIALLPDPNPVFIIEDVIGEPFGIPNGIIGELCEIVRQVITGERKPDDFETGIKEKLDEDNQPRANEIAFAINEQILTKLMPAIGLKAPVVVKLEVPKVIEAESKVGTPPSPRGGETSLTPRGGGTSFTPRGVETPTQEPPPRVVPINRIPNNQSPNSKQIQIPNTQTKNSPLASKLEARSYTLIPNQPKPRPPIVEVSHAGMSASPLESLMKMVAESKVRESELQNRFDRLPEALKQSLVSIDSAKKVVDIGRKYALHVDKIGILGIETGLVILGFTHPADFISHLSRRLGIPEDKARPVAQEINTEIFLKIRDALKEVNGEAREGIINNQDTITKQIPIPNVQTGTNPPPASKLEARSYMLPSLPSRDDVLRDIENPPPFNQPTTDPTLSPPPYTQYPKPFPNPPPAPLPKPPTTAPSPSDIIGQKLSQTSVSGKTESRYTVDPYRETI